MSNLLSHDKSKKHIELQNSAGPYPKLCFKKPGETVNENVSDLQNLEIPLLSTQAEIRWVLKVVYPQFTFRSRLGLRELFQSMFGDNDAIKHSSLNKTQCSYQINFGLASYFKDKLLLAIKASPFYSVLSRAMNSVLQEEQMDIHIRFLDCENSLVETRYFDSKFMYRANQDNLCQLITRSTEGLPKTNMNQLSVDGPNTNWAVLEKFIAAREENDEPKFAEVGGCSLGL